MLGELSPHEIEHVLRAEWVARLGLCDRDRPYVVPVNYAYEDDAIYAHSNDGHKLRLLRGGHPVCVEVDAVENLANWRSVIAWGRFEELHGADAMRALNLLVARFSPLMAAHATTPTHGRPHPDEADQSVPPAAIYRIVLTEKTGRFERR
ncbi:MAG: pyridoxamine 5'-phosphate oxidase family protein [Gemmatimonadetes bacterium]|nr:pyridoxamine 5'-phosphate oxidase family protein [Gemmatimonadota bacterium]